MKGYGYRYYFAGRQDKWTLHASFSAQIENFGWSDPLMGLLPLLWRKPTEG